MRKANIRRAMRRRKKRFKRKKSGAGAFDERLFRKNLKSGSAKNGGVKASTGMDRSTDSRPELVDGSVKIDRKINNDKKIVPLQNANPMPMMGFGFMPIAA